MTFERYDARLQEADWPAELQALRRELVDYGQSLHARLFGDTG